MRRIYFSWIIAVIGIFGTVYGAYLLAYHFNHGNGLSVLSLVLLILGIVCLSLSIPMWIISYINNKKRKDEPTPPPVKEEPKEEMVEQPKEEKIELVQRQKPVHSGYVSRSDDKTYTSYVPTTVYVKQVGYGPVLRVEGNRILDMRSNTYYRIEGNMVNQEGYGPVFEIRDNQIRSAFGGYLYELSGSNINKVYGGFYASISGNYISLYDLSMKYEMTDSLSKKQILVVAALLFGSY